jgi:hypothetical protein
MKKEANAHAIALRRILHHLLGEVVVVKHLGEAQAIPEGGAPAEEINEKELETGDLRVDMAEAMDDLQEGMVGVTEIKEANNAAPKPRSAKKKSHSGSTSPTKIRRWERREPRWLRETYLRETPRASKPKRPRTMET